MKVVIIAFYIFQICFDVFVIGYILRRWRNR